MKKKKQCTEKFFETEIILKKFLNKKWRQRNLKKIHVVRDFLLLKNSFENETLKIEPLGFSQSFLFLFKKKPFPLRKGTSRGTFS